MAVNKHNAHKFSDDELFSALENAEALGGWDLCDAIDRELEIREYTEDEDNWFDVDGPGEV